MKYKYILTAVAAVMLFAGQASAVVKTATMQVSLNNIAVVNVSTSPINFGDVTTGTSTITSTGSISVNATSGANYKISIDNGLHSYTSGTCRSLKATGSLANRRYQTFKNSAYTLSWGDSDTQATCTTGTNFTSGGSSLVRTGNGVNQPNIVYVKAFAGSTIGSLSDTLTVTVSY